MNMLTSALLAPTEALLNGLLAQDPAASNKLQRLSTPDAQGLQPVVSATVSSPFRWQVFLLPAGDRVQLRAVYDGPVSASVSASASSYSRMLMSDNVRTALFDPDIELGGNTQLIQGLFEVFRDLDFDWEHHLQNLTGGVMTQQLSSTLQSLNEWSRDAARSMRSNVREYLHEESRLLPERTEVDEFFVAVDDLRLQLDRIEARVQHLRAVSQTPDSL